DRGIVVRNRGRLKMPIRGPRSQPETAGAPESPGPGRRFPEWLRSGTGLAISGLWLVLLLAAFLVVRPAPATAALEVLAAMFGLYASSVAFRKDPASGYVILIALA